jgi:hypothetical protein
MHKTLGGVEQASLGLINTMLVTATTALSIITLESVWRFLDRLRDAEATADMVRRGVKESPDSRNDIRYNLFDARRIPARRGGFTFPTNANRDRRYARRKTEQRPLPV